MKICQRFCVVTVSTSDTLSLRKQLRKNACTKRSTARLKIASWIAKETSDKELQYVKYEQPLGSIYESVTNGMLSAEDRDILETAV